MLLHATAIISCLAALGLCPLVALAIARVRFGKRAPMAVRYALRYYAALMTGAVFIVMTVVLNNARGALTELMIPLACAAGLIALLATLAGPFVALHLLAGARAQNERSSICGRCGYNLQGNVTGICSECGSPVGELRRAPKLIQRLETMPWRRALPAWLAVLIFMAGVFGHAEVRKFYVCTECCLVKVEGAHLLTLPFISQPLLEIPDLSETSYDEQALTPLLDPEGKCTHNWQYADGSGRSLAGRWHSQGKYRCFDAAVPYAPRLREFLTDRPEMLDKIRAILPNPPEDAGLWLMEEYQRWEDEKYPPDPLRLVPTGDEPTSAEQGAP